MSDGTVGVLVGAALAACFQWLFDKRRESREDADHAAARKVSLWLFADEAIALHRRWVLYAQQAYNIVHASGPNERNGLSASRPYEWIRSSTIERFLRVGGTQEIVHAVYRVKQLNAQITLQLDRAHDNDPHAIGRILGFTFASDEWHPVCDAIRLLLNRARKAGNDITDLQQTFEAQFRQGEGIREAAAPAQIAGQ